MRPTAQETLAGVVRILRGTVVPKVDDGHAQAQLRHAIRVLEQLPADPRSEAAAELASLQAIAEVCREWMAAADDRSGFTPLDDVDPTCELDTRVEDVRRSLEHFLVELRQWRAANGTASSQEIFVRIGTSLTEPTTGSR